ncbi:MULTISPECIES: flavodoxin domain-containing protein [Amycolatopsis]|uniref:Flavodoxin n=1 Tax=Amycolatopsis dendrobii TaxID=2760662 RepID=A0A7W3W7G8_9PSEU|nr:MULTISPECIES: flavodoxin domain-containing protein [Amycolatopsis]MBB1160268.1 flavodoxin [Amycolatopsis dendrobii]UKD56122.1 flavodoxin domain-containing protein [Amycolatopsis sp. FU40]
MINVLVAYAGKRGGTREIAEVVGEELRAAGFAVDVRAAGEVDGVAGYAAVVVGSALYYARWRPEAVRLLERNTEALRVRPVWLFHSGPCGPGANVARVGLPARVTLLAAAIDAGRTETFGGRLDPALADGVLEKVMARGNRVGDFRDWERIRAWARDIGRRVRSRVPI